MTYQGFRNWTVWNVSLWAHNTEIMYYSSAYEAVKRQGKAQAGLLAAYVKEVWPKTTPDGAQLRHMKQADWEDLAESLKV